MRSDSNSLNISIAGESHRIATVNLTVTPKSLLKPRLEHIENPHEVSFNITYFLSGFSRVRNHFFGKGGKRRPWTNGEPMWTNGQIFKNGTSSNDPILQHSPIGFSDFERPEGKNMKELRLELEKMKYGKNQGLLFCRIFHTTNKSQFSWKKQDNFSKSGKNKKYLKIPITITKYPKIFIQAFINGNHVFNSCFKKSLRSHSFKYRVIHLGFGGNPKQKQLLLAQLITLTAGPGSLSSVEGAKWS